MGIPKVSLQSLHIKVLVLLLLIAGCGDGKGQKAKHKYTNALVNETSPYLLQHAHNPVNWQPWTQDALEQAEKENKLVLVSVGYSSCHWCHVMEEETFEDEEVAAIMNESFINIKVDREERPDVDQVYMTALQLLTGSGGWPLNVITLPNGKPLYAGTYHTKEQWTQVLTKVSNMYHQDPEKAAEYADNLAKGVQEVNQIQVEDTEVEIQPSQLKQVVDKWAQNWDTQWGGDKGDIKYMMPVNVNFLLEYGILNSNKVILDHVENTLDQMARGGIYDQLGGGFYRYSTDPRWHIPHFEKMLYDNAQLIGLYAKAYKFFTKDLYKQVVEETTAFLDREMKDGTGGYYAALDADSDGEEGKYYIWTQAELQELLGTDFELFAQYFDIQPGSVWEENSFVLRKLVSDALFASEHSITAEELEGKKRQWKTLLLGARDQRVRPGLDDKIIISWNALLANGFLEAYKAFGDTRYKTRAEGIMDFIKDKGTTGGGLIHSYKPGGKHHQGFLEDYAYLMDAALSMYSCSLEQDYLHWAEQLQQQLTKQFYDDESGMYRYSAGEELISKIIKTHDGVMPSPNAIMAKNLLLLGHIHYNKSSLEQSKKMVLAMLPALDEGATYYAQWAQVFMNTAYPFYEIAIVGPDANTLMAEIQQRVIPNTLLVGNTKSSELPLFEGRFVAGETYIYVCKDTSCKLPVTTVDESMIQLENF